MEERVKRSGETGKKTHCVGKKTSLGGGKEDFEEEEIYSQRKRLEWTQ